MEISITSVLALLVGLIVGRLFFNPKNMIKENTKLREKNDNLQNENIKLREEKSRLEERNKSLENRESEVKGKFELIAQNVLKEMGSDFNKTQNEKMGDIVSPLKQQLEDFKSKIDERDDDILKQRTQLKSELDAQKELNQQLSRDAKDLTEALKGDSKKIGNWGEMTLRKILELSGLREGEGFVEQVKQESTEGKTQYLDFRINFQDNKHLIVDAKVCFNAYKEFVKAESEEDKSSSLKKHVKSVKERIKELSEKDYHASDDVNSPEFVFLFMSPEPAFIAAMEKDPNLYQYAWEKNIVLMSPSLLMAALKTVNSMWVRERGRRNDSEIAMEAGRMYDGFCKFLNSLKKIGDNIKKAKESYEEAEGQLSTNTRGNLNLIKRAKKIQELGARTTKNIELKWDTGDIPDESTEKESKKEIVDSNGKLPEASLNKTNEAHLVSENKVSTLTRINSE